jgi:hypothetical protein
MPACQFLSRTSIASFALGAFLGAAAITTVVVLALRPSERSGKAQTGGVPVFDWEGMHVLHASNKQIQMFASLWIFLPMTCDLRPHSRM